MGFHMVQTLDRAVAKVKTLSQEMQEQAAHILLAFAGDDPPALALTPEETLDLIQAQEERKRGDLAAEADVEAVLSKYRR